MKFDYHQKVYSGENYLKVSGMAKDKTWATESEIFATATLLQCTVYVWSRFGRNLCWQVYS